MKTRKISLLIENGLALAFFLSYASYFFESSQAFQAAPVVIIIVLGVVAWIAEVVRNIVFSSNRIMIPASAYYVVIIIIFTLPSSIANMGVHSFSLGYWVAISAVLIAACGITNELHTKHVFRAALKSFIPSLLLTLVIGFDSIRTAAILEGSFVFSHFHYNLLGFIYAGFISAIVWALMTNQKVILWIFLLLSLLIIFLASSRGSLIAILVGGGAVLIAYGCKVLPKVILQRPIAVLFGLVMLSFGALVFGLWLSLSTSGAFIVDYVDRALYLSSPYRGLDSGLTGRLTYWEAMSEKLNHGVWFHGMGFKAGDLIQFPIDNGYLVVLYECGLLPLLLIVGRYFWILGKCMPWVGSYEDAEACAVSVAMIFFISMFLVNNIVARFLFGIGNPVSLMALLFLCGVSFKSEALKGTASRRVALGS